MTSTAQTLVGGKPLKTFFSQLLPLHLILKTYQFRSIHLNPQKNQNKTLNI